MDRSVPEPAEPGVEGVIGPDADEISRRRLPSDGLQEFVRIRPTPNPSEWGVSGDWHSQITETTQSVSSDEGQFR